MARYRKKCFVQYDPDLGIAWCCWVFWKLIQRILDCPLQLVIVVNRQSFHADERYWSLLSCWSYRFGICLVITRSAWNYCRLYSSHQSPCLHGLTGSRCPQHHLRSCCCARAYARVISWQNDRLGQYKQVPSLSGAIPSSPNSAPDLASCNSAHTTSSWNAIFVFAFQL